LGLAAGHAIYVVDILPESNTVIVGEDEDLLRDSLMADQVHWQSGSSPGSEFEGLVKIRYRQSSTPATIAPGADGRAVVTFRSPQRAITPGQSVVFYDGSDVLGGGIILQ
ncbi:MAG: tRNA 2-thiouridine(34) synthase MnmA, partial [Candidatus Latescibacteria bacterium]|nr:tRNA 2-thiouridine(34) synthase MnmA [Candidatus Latescibacterota bacterium]